MLLNRMERVFMNNPLRGVVQKRYEAKKLLRLGGPMDGGCALEIGCGRGVGAGIILDLFGADSVHAFDLDPSMVVLAQQRLSVYGSRAVVWVGDAGAISSPAMTYDAVFDFGMIHHVPDWRGVLEEIRRVLKPGGCFYAEEVLRSFIGNPMVRRVFEHPQVDRFDAEEFVQGLESAGFEILGMETLWGAFGWFSARRCAEA